MTEQEILEGNKLIADFMEYKHSVYAIIAEWEMKMLKYHSLWDWLMPVWFKIRDLKFKEVKHEFEHADIKQNCVYAICYRDIQSAYHEIVNAIKWYNTILNK